jgi:hypothetical protein
MSEKAKYKTQILLGFGVALLGYILFTSAIDHYIVRKALLTMPQTTDKRSSPSGVGEDIEAKDEPNQPDTSLIKMQDQAIWQRIHALPPQ